MTRRFAALAGAALAFTVAGTPPKAAEPPPSPGVQERAERALRESAEKFMRALEMLLDSVPQYEMPEILENGDIIIRRKKREEPPEKEKPAPMPDGAEST